ncbi:uncharacterized protein PAF06_007310 [Gastrophryne carolinensis]
MASADLRKELDCYICLNIYSDPVTLGCGHSFCRGCIDHALEAQEEYGDYSCPQCRQKFEIRPTLERNITLNNIVKNLQSTQADQEETQIFCTYCIHAPVAAAKSCLLCEASLCEDHLRVHSKSPEHVLCNPTTTLKYRKCSAHKKILEYYCTEDSALICVSCSLAGEHRGHRVEMIDEAFESRKKKLKDARQKLETKKEETEEAVQQLRIKKDELSRKMQRIEELCNMSDPLTVLQEPDLGGLCDIEEEKRDNPLQSAVTDEIYLPEPADVLIDINTAHKNLHITNDRKTVCDLGVDQNRPETPERFQWCSQVMGSQGFSTGRLYWEVDVTGAHRWKVGMCYPTTARGGSDELFGRSSKSWCLDREDDDFYMTHGWNRIPLEVAVTSNRVRIYLNYEAGQLSFYDLCHPIRHLHTFTHTFTEPLHAALMASADLRKELDCYICLNIYSDPVTLGCGHSFCRGCIDHALEAQEEYGDYSCPQCRQKFEIRPTLERNITLNNIVKNLQSTQADQEETQIFCTYCIHAPVAAAKSCLLCEASLCEDHLRVHSKSPEHVLCNPTTTLKYRKCSAHKKILEYYCTEDSALICVSCSLAGEHRGHRVEMIDEAFESRKKKLKDARQKLETKKEETEEAVQQLRIKKDELSRKMQRIEELCNMSDPLTVLQEPDLGGLCDIEEEKRDNPLQSAVTDEIYLPEPADVLIDINTAHKNLHITNDRKTVCDLGVDQNRPETPERFQWCSQVMGSQGFSTGRLYWEVDVTGAHRWKVGMCYPTTARGGSDELFGRSSKSWCLDREDDDFYMTHGWNRIPLEVAVTSNRVRIYLNYEAGQLSFYDLCHPIRHLHTFTHTFTEPLHAALEYAHTVY